jgi:copper chaperone
MGGIGILLCEGEFAAMENKLNLSIEGMHCAACVRRVTNALTGLEGVHVESVEVGSAKVAFDKARVSPDQVVAAVDGIGFTAHNN